MAQDAHTTNGHAVADRPRRSKAGQVRLLPIRFIRPAPENDKLYRPVRDDDPEIEALAESIRTYGLKEPLVISQDQYLISGHRRLAACKLAGLTQVPVIVEEINRWSDPDGFLVLLREYNRQRTKTFDEQLREEVVSLNPEETYEALIEHRKKSSAVKVDCLKLPPATKRKKISAGKMPMLEAIIKIVNERRQFWPLSDRGIHYLLLNDPPLRHALKLGSRYINDRKSYKDLCDLLLRARIARFIPWAAIDDPTRPFTCWNVHRDAATFLREQISDFGRGYWRNLMQSQPNHIEIVGEKNTLGSVLNQIAMKYCIPTTMGRGYASGPPREKMAQRYFDSGKDKLVVLMVTDFDPDGLEIAKSFAKSMRDDFDVDEKNVHAVRVGLTIEQVRKHKLPVGGQAKKDANGYREFVAKYGTDVYEVEAIDPTLLQGILTTAIDSVIDVDAFNGEIDQEKRDAVYLERVRRMVCGLLKDAKFEDLE